MEHLSNTDTDFSVFSFVGSIPIPETIKLFTIHKILVLNFKRYNNVLKECDVYKQIG